MLEYSLIGIKPDAFAPDSDREAGSELRKPLPENPEDFVEEFRARLRGKCLRILTEKHGTIDKETASEHYAEHRGIFDERYGVDKHDFLVGYMTSGPSHFMVVFGESAVKAGREALAEIREEYLLDRKKARFNMSHASDSAEGAKAEILLHFKDFVFVDPCGPGNPDSVDFSGFEGRKEALSDIYRYSNYATSLYRSNLFVHSRRIFFLLRKALPELLTAFPGLDVRKTELLALVHDDAEILTGDHQSVNRLKMTPEQIAEVDGQEEKAIGRLAATFPEFLESYEYRDLLRSVFEKDTPEAQVVKFLDHIDGFCEALHEIYAGNACFVTQPNTEYGKVPIPPDYYIPRFAQPEKYYPLLADAIGFGMPFMRDFQRIDFESVAKSGKPHVRESILDSTGYPLYDWWKATVWESNDAAVRDGLLTISAKVEM